MDRFSDFSPAARRSLEIAMQEAETFKRAQVGGEHLLVGLASARGGDAASILQGLGIGRSAMREALEATAGETGAYDGPVLLGPDTKRIVEAAIDEARRRGQAKVLTTHILLALASEPSAGARALLAAMAVDMGNLIGLASQSLEAPIQYE